METCRKTNVSPKDSKKDYSQDEVLNKYIELVKFFDNLKKIKNRLATKSKKIKKICGKPSKNKEKMIEKTAFLASNSTP